MNIEIRTDKNIQNSDRLITYVRAELNAEFQRYSERITHFSVHFSDENGPKGGADDIHCMIEAKAAGLKPVVVTHKAHNIFPMSDATAKYCPQPKTRKPEKIIQFIGFSK